MSLPLFGSRVRSDPCAELDVRVAMRDGTELSADVFLPPSGDGPWPTLLTRTPYDNLRQAEEAAFFAGNGFAVVCQDVRGRGDSDGVFDPWLQEFEDGHDTVEWAGAQPWSNGDVGIYGGSYQAYCAWAAARDRPQGLKAIASRATSGFWLLGVPHDLGTARPYWLWVFNLTSGRTLQAALDRESPAIDWARILRTKPLEEMDLALGRRIPAWRRLIEARAGDPYTSALDLSSSFERVDFPTLHLTGWFDGAQWGELGAWREVTASSSDPNRHFLVVGPWDHYGTAAPRQRTGGRDFGPDSAVSVRELTLRFFDHAMRQRDNGFAGEPAVRYFVMGSDRWKSDRSWPPAAAVDLALFLHSDGSASANPGGTIDDRRPESAEPPDFYTYDPDDPTPSSEEESAFFTSEAMLDNRWLLGRDDVLVYTSSPLQRPISVVGNPKLVLWASSDAPDTDFHVALCDVAPSGRSDVIARGFVRAAYRHGPDASPAPLDSTEPTHFTIELSATANRFLRGHRLRLVVASAQFPDFDRNPNTAAPLGDDRDSRVASNGVHHDAASPSCLLLPGPEQAPGRTGNAEAVSLVPLPPAALEALLESDLDAASEAAGAELPPAFLDEGWLWRFRLGQARADPESEPWLVRAVIADGTVVGHASFHGPPDQSGVVVVAYLVLPEFRGRGYAKAALEALISYAVDDGSVSIVRATISPDNAASLAIIEAFGFEPNGQQWDEEDGLELIFDLDLAGLNISHK